MKEINTIIVNGETFMLRKKGKWIKKETARYVYYICGKCKGELSWKGRYCPYCGSEMETEL